MFWITCTSGFCLEPREGTREIKSRTEFLEGGRIQDGTASGGWETTVGTADQISEWLAASDFPGKSFRHPLIKL